MYIFKLKYKRFLSYCKNLIYLYVFLNYQDLLLKKIKTLKKLNLFQEIQPFFNIVLRLFA